MQRPAIMYMKDVSAGPEEEPRPSGNSEICLRPGRTPSLQALEYLLPSDCVETSTMPAPQVHSLSKPHTLYFWTPSERFLVYGRKWSDGRRNKWLFPLAGVCVFECWCLTTMTREALLVTVKVEWRWSEHGRSFSASWNITTSTAAPV